MKWCLDYVDLLSRIDNIQFLESREHEASPVALGE